MEGGLYSVHRDDRWRANDPGRSHRYIYCTKLCCIGTELLEIDLLAQGSFSPTGMRKYYSVEDEEKYGVMGIRIRVVSLVSTEV